MHKVNKNQTLAHEPELVYVIRIFGYGQYLIIGDII